MNEYSGRLTARIIARDQDEAAEIFTENFPCPDSDLIKVVESDVMFEGKLPEDEVVGTLLGPHISAISSAIRKAFIEATKKYPDSADLLWLEGVEGDGQYLDIQIGLYGEQNYRTTIDLTKETA